MRPSISTSRGCTTATTWSSCRARGPGPAASASRASTSCSTIRAPRP